MNCEHDVYILNMYMYLRKIHLGKCNYKSERALIIPLCLIPSLPIIAL